MFVNVNFHTNAGKVGETVRYVAHREETLPEARTREIYGIGPATGSCGGTRLPSSAGYGPMAKESRSRTSSVQIHG